MKNINYFLTALAVCLSLSAAPAPAKELVSYAADGGQETITLSLSDYKPNKVFTVPRPDRLVVDVPTLPGRRELSLPSSYRGRLIKDVRFGQFDPDTSRFVFDLNRPVRIVGVRESGGLIVRIAEEKEGDAETGSSPWPGTEKAMDRTAQSGTDTPHYGLKRAARITSRKGGKPMVVIDPGHGGVDPGTIGNDDSEEKDITLQYAKMLKVRLLKTGRYQVKLTREDDRFIMLRRRVAIARKAQADIFISLHADSAPDMVRGLSLYTVSERASDAETEALAARENKSDIIAGIDLSDERDDVAGILISLAERDTMNRSAMLADALVLSFEDRVRLLSNSHRFAGFAVLKAPDVPSVLIEIGFLSHPQEEKLINSKAYRDKVTTGIVAGIDAYFHQQKESRP